MHLGTFLPLFLTSLVFAGCAASAPPPAVPAPPAPAVASPKDEDPALLAGRRWVKRFYERETKTMWDAMGAPLRKLVRSKEGLDAFRTSLDDLGPEASVLAENVEHDGPNALYVRTVRFERAADAFKIVVGVSGDRLEAFGVSTVESKTEPAPTTRLDYRTRAPVRLPFEGTWHVGWGGRTLEENHHVVMRDQRFAYDFLVMSEGKTHRGDGRSNADYHCYGRPILAPAAGRVVAVVDGIPDNVPGEMDAEHPAGNYVLLDHGNEEVSLLAHLQPGSSKVKAGERVEAGQPLGRCGNSGHSSEPHLHYQLQDAPRFGDADGLPAQFRTYVADGKPVASGEPVRGQSIRSVAIPFAPAHPPRGARKARR